MQRSLDIKQDGMMKDMKVLGFDLDGTLVKMKIDLRSFKQDMGIPEGDTLEHIASLPRERAEKLLKLLKEREMEAAMAAEASPGSHDLLSYCKKAGISTVVITRNSQEAAELTLLNLDFEVDMVLSRENSKPKPSPEAFDIVISQYSIEPHQMAYVGDYIYDIQAGNSAGVRTILVATQERSNEWAPSADHVIEDLYDLLDLIREGRERV